MSVKKEVELVIESNYHVLYTPKDFLYLTSYANAKLVLSRLCNQNKIKRLIDGIYYKPYFSEFTNMEIPISPYVFVDKISDIYDWNICVYGEAALNYFGISTQIPSKYVFITDGPYREYKLDSVIVKLKHTNKNIKNISFNVSAALECIKFMGKERVTDEHLSLIYSQLTKEEIAEIKTASRKAPIWIYQFIERMLKNNE